MAKPAVFCLSIFALLFTSSLCSVVPIHVGRSRARFMRLEGVQAESHLVASASASSVVEKYFVQVLDHFEIDAADQNKLWKQRYWVNTQYWDASNPGPVFVQLGEEGAASSNMVTNMAMVEYGKKHGALLVAIEHRGYGKSYATPSLATNYMKYISVDQAMADFANVILGVKKDYNAEASKVVVFGCSYIGAGASWFRARYGHVAIGAIASSAPVQAVVDFTQYLDQVGKDLKIFYGEQCDAYIRNATSQVTTLLNSTDGVARVKELFSLCDAPKSENDVMTFWSTIIGSPWMGSVQYYSESPAMPTIKDMCSLLTASSDPLEGYVDVYNKWGNPSGQCMDISYEAMITALQNTTQPATGVGDRTWTWQTCSQFGYFQSTDSDNQPFGSGMPVKFYENMCNDAFGMTFNLEQNIRNTNVKFGGQNLPEYAYTNVAFDGSADGVWEVLAPQSAVNPTCPLFTFTSEGHCAGVFPLTPDTPNDIVQVHHNIDAELSKWV